MSEDRPIKSRSRGHESIYPTLVGCTPEKGVLRRFLRSCVSETFPSQHN